MRRISVLGAAALLAVLPAATHAQSTSQEVVVKESTTVVVKEAPKPSPVTFTPYGFFVLNAFFNDAVGNRNYPLPNACSGGAPCEGNVLFDVRQTRLGSRLVLQRHRRMDQGDALGPRRGRLPGRLRRRGSHHLDRLLQPGHPAPEGLRRRRLGHRAKFTLRIGQDDHIVSLLRPVSLAYIANPLFQFAGTLNGRAPMIEARFDLNPKDGLAVNAQVAAVNPQDNTAGDDAPVSPPAAAVDLGAGNRSRVPAFEGRVAVGSRPAGRRWPTLAGWGGWQKNRFVSPATDTNVDVNSSIIGGDMTLNIWMVNVLGSIYSAKGWDQPGSLGASQGIALTVAAPVAPTTRVCHHQRHRRPRARRLVPGPGRPGRPLQGLRRLGRHAEPVRRLHRARLLAVNRHPRPELPVGRRPHRLRRQELALLGRVLPRHQLLLHRQLLPGPVLPQLPARLLAAAAARSACSWPAAALTARRLRDSTCTTRSDRPPRPGRDGIPRGTARPGSPRHH